MKDKVPDIRHYLSVFIIIIIIIIIMIIIFAIIIILKVHVCTHSMHYVSDMCHLPGH